MNNPTDARRRYGLYIADLRRDRTRSHGIINYAIGLARALPPRLAPDERLFIYANPAIAQELEADDGPRLRIRLLNAPRGAIRRLSLDHVTVTRAANRDRLHVLHLPKGFVPFWRPASLGCVATVHDDIAVRYARGELADRPDRSLRARYFDWSTGHTLRAADRICTVSEFSRDRILAVAASDGLSSPPVTVTYQASSLPSMPVLPRTDKERWLLHIGSLLPHKRSGDAVRWTTRYLRERDADLQLVVTGTLDPDTAKFARDSGARLIDEVLTSRELAELLRRSRALIFTSTYEGFGLPPLEAYFLGTPVAFAQAEAVTEVLGDIAGGYDPAEGYQAFVRALDAALALEEASVAEIRRQLAARFNWSAVADRTLQAYRMVAGKTTK